LLLIKWSGDDEHWCPYSPARLVGAHRAARRDAARIECLRRDGSQRN
jgi:hypothetical protein